ncbi:hypothetical protein NBH19_15780 [Rhizobium sp. S95]|uniref:Uncharacterized protein n=1 Tax=Ciceribacter sichuanensis TaxID=2949647 RepID=A0AAJ1F6Q5_9HYPH|nr:MULTISPECIES: hypothetical protein [unclassified Ciceribacter]MCM2397534.1 hypothetical protein [Ciceribacter sp. S95]MCM2399772.1 hypothetical protein [Ciceribacter sp. S153]MCO5956183.1 hypothetical protein [Ciceribacter sp. S101]
MRRHFMPAIAALCIFSVAPALAGNLNVTLENETEGMIVKFFASPANGKGQRLELLNKHGLGKGKSRTLTLVGGSDVCEYRVRAVFEDSAEYQDVSDKIDFCEVDTYTIED